MSRFFSELVRVFFKSAAGCFGTETDTQRIIMWRNGQYYTNFLTNMEFFVPKKGNKYYNIC